MASDTTCSMVCEGVGFVCDRAGVDPWDHLDKHLLERFFTRIND